MEPVLTTISEYTGRSTRLSHVCHSWREILHENDDNIMDGIMRTYGKSLYDDSNTDSISVSEIIRVALDNKDIETIRLITTVYTQEIPIPWDTFAPIIDNYLLAWYFSFRLKKGSEYDRLTEMYMFANQYCKDHVEQLGNKYTKSDIIRILKAGSIDRVWGWLDTNQKHKLIPILKEIVSSFYIEIQGSRRKRREEVPVIVPSNVPLPSVNLPWLYYNGFLNDDSLIAAIIADDPNDFDIAKQHHLQYTNYINQLINELSAVNIYIANYTPCKYFATLPSSDKYISVIINDKTTLLKGLDNARHSKFPVNMLYRIWKQCGIPSVREKIYCISMDNKSIDMIDMFLTEKNYMRVIIDAIQSHGMYDSLFDLIVFKRIHAEWFSYYLHGEIDPVVNIPTHLLNSKTGTMTLPRNIEDWKALYKMMMNLKPKLEGLVGVKAPPKIWPLLIGNAIIYDRNGAFLTSLIRVHALEITQSMVNKMRMLFQKNEREGGWDSFAISMRDLGVSPQALAQ